MTTIISKYGNGVPKDSDLQTGELGIDLQTHSIYTKDGGGKIIKLSDGDAVDHVNWDDILGKPDTFPPEDHTHSQDEIEGLGDKLTEIDGNISDLEDGLAAIATTLAFGGSFDASNNKIVKGAKLGIVDGESIPAASTQPNTFLICSVAGNQSPAGNTTDLAEGDWLVSNGTDWVPIAYSSGSAGSVDWDNIQNKPDFDGIYAPIDHGHEIDDIDGLQDALDSLPQDGHKHVIDDVEGLQAALDSKASIDLITGGTY